MFIVWVVLAVVAGIGLPVQVGVNNTLRMWVGSPVVAAIASFVVGTAALVIAALIMRAPVPDGMRLSAAPWWVWTGGLFGAVYIFVTVLLAPRLGAALLLSLTVGGQMLCALLLDQWGAFGFPQHPISAGRVVGGLMIAAGVVLVRIM